MKYAKGIMWLDDCRIPYIDEIPNIGGRANHGRGSGYGFIPMLEQIEPNTQGRFTPNLLVCDDMLNDGKIYGNLFKQTRNKHTDGGTGNSLVRRHKQGESNGVFDNGTSSSRFYDLDKWFDKMIDEIR